MCLWDYFQHCLSSLRFCTVKYWLLCLCFSIFSSILEHRHSNQYMVMQNDFNDPVANRFLYSFLSGHFGDTQMKH